MNPDITEDMKWHSDKRVDDEDMRHLVDTPQWKRLDEKYLEFSRETRNVRLGFATDGFNPFGPNKSRTNIDVYLRPLVDELKELWKNGVRTYDASTSDTFGMHVAIIRSIHDLPAYGHVFGWRTKGYLACPTCNDSPLSHKLISTKNSERNKDGGVRGLGMEIFHQHVRLFSPIARAPDPSQKEREMAHWFVLYNCPKVEPYLEYVFILVSVSITSEVDIQVIYEI
ncbi:hypothetical protein RHSIM_Rhsim08G0151600 [Rhododendron simsii]|uniref:DUF4218 domain-containing protein n=1 Tax=Rhododendron simsii TaxID=118357 RepID=A0A834LIV1_RHOSS|nr:hypothetical protein RHSIM_Rhsim08G0151600 [Rhododendron simsii]